jgi:hypothetical protein
MFDWTAAPAITHQFVLASIHAITLTNASDPNK